MIDILLCDDVRMCIGLDSIVLRRKSEGIKSHREQNIVALHSSLTCKNLDT